MTCHIKIYPMVDPYDMAHIGGTQYKDSKNFATYEKRMYERNSLYNQKLSSVVDKYLNLLSKEHIAGSIF